MVWLYIALRWCQQKNTTYSSGTDFTTTRKTKNKYRTRLICCLSVCVLRPFIGIVQGELVDSVEHHVESTGDYIKQGQFELKQAEMYQSKARKVFSIFCRFNQSECSTTIIYQQQKALSLVLSVSSISNHNCLTQRFPVEWFPTESHVKCDSHCTWYNCRIKMISSFSFAFALGSTRDKSTRNMQINQTYFGGFVCLWHRKVNKVELTTWNIIRNLLERMMMKTKNEWTNELIKIKPIENTNLKASHFKINNILCIPVYLIFVSIAQLLLLLVGPLCLASGKM